MNKVKIINTETQESEIISLGRSAEFNVITGLLKIQFEFLDIFFKYRRILIKSLNKIKQGFIIEDLENFCSYIITSKTVNGWNVELRLEPKFSKSQDISNSYYFVNPSNVNVFNNYTQQNIQQMITQLPLEDQELAKELLEYLKNANSLEKGALAKFKKILSNTDWISFIGGILTQCFFFS